MAGVLVAACVGCGFHPISETEPGSDGAPADVVRHDANEGSEQIITVIDALPCASGGLIDVCLMAPPPALALSNETINTDNDPRCIAGETEGCVIGARVISVTGMVGAIGTKPLILVAETTITVTGVLDVSSTRLDPPGAGANAASCATPNPGTNGNGGAGGGAGGSFGGAGGTGGEGDNNGASRAGGVAALAQMVTAVRGGCKGAKGGNGSAGAEGGGGGNGGGAVYLAAGMSITIGSTGAVYASGAGGGGGAVYEAAGGGGGSGGLVGLDAPTITVAGIVAANGGGGGGGTSIVNPPQSVNGGAGGDGTRTAYNTTATGGTKGRTDAGTGGAGTGGTTTIGQTPASVPAGAGGGGGGAGVVWVRGALTGTTISPAIEQH